LLEFENAVRDISIFELEIAEIKKIYLIGIESLPKLGFYNSYIFANPILDLQKY